MDTTGDRPTLPRLALRRQLLLDRERLVASAAAEAPVALARHLLDALAALEPQTLGLYMPVKSEFNAAAALAGDTRFAALPLALPYARRTPREMHYRRWDGQAPAGVDECGIPASDGAAVVPDVVIAPCVGYTRSGYRLGYGGGYFDRYLALHPHVTAVGLAWSASCIDETQLQPQAHDRPMMLIVTERGVISG